MKFFRIIWRVLFFVNAILTFFIFFPVFWILLSKEKWFKKVFRVKKIWAHLLFYNVGIRYKIIRNTNLDPNQPYIICPNHSSYLDIILTYLAIPVYFHFMGKAELRKVPLFNKFFDRMNILVDRGSIRGSHRAFMRASQDIDKGISISIFPEATIPNCAPKLGRFKNGAFKLAIDKQIPIIPVVYVDNWKILPDADGERNNCGPGLSRVVIHDPIETKGMTDADLEPLKKKIFSIIEQTLKEYNDGNK